MTQTQLVKARVVVLTLMLAMLLVPLNPATALADAADAGCSNPGPWVHTDGVDYRICEPIILDGGTK